MITIDQAKTLDLFHVNGCRCLPGRGRKVAVLRIEAWHRNGQTKLRGGSTNFALPIRRQDQRGYLTQANADCFHAEEDCPALKKLHEVTHLRDLMKAPTFPDAPDATMTPMDVVRLARAASDLRGDQG